MAYSESSADTPYANYGEVFQGSQEPAAQSLADRYPQIVDAYQTYLGRMPSDAEILSQTGNGTFASNDPRIQRSVQSIAMSPEAKQRPAATTPTTPSSGADAGDPWSTAPADGNWEAWFRANTKGELSPAQLIALEGTLGKHGIKVLRNAAGVAGKVTLPNGQIVDVIEKAGSGGTRFQWLTGDGGSGGAPAAATVPDMDWFTANTPAPEPFSNPEVPGYLKEPYTPPVRPDSLQQPYVAPEFTAPGFDELANDPGYKARLNAGVLARDRMAAARGTILSGGYGKAIERYAQEFGNNEYQNLYGRRFGEFQTQAGLGLGARQLNEGAYQADVSNAQNTYGIRNEAYQDAIQNAANQYATRYKTYRDAIGDRFNLAEMGLRATTAGRF